MVNPTIFVVLNGDQIPKNLLASLDDSGNYILYSVPTVDGQPVSDSNRMPVEMDTTPPAVDATGGDAFSIVTGGAAVVAFQGGTIVFGAYIANPKNATESLFVDPVNAPAVASPGTSGTTIELYPGDRWDAPPGLQNQVRVNAATSGHAFVAVRY